MQDRLNPILLREMRSRIRNRSTLYGVVGFALFQGGIAAIIYSVMYNTTTYTQTITPTIVVPTIQLGPMIGKVIFGVIFGLMLVTLPFTGSTLASDAIAGEKERQTFEILRITPLTSHRIIWGKIFAVFSLLLLYILLGLPMLSLSFAFGGVTLTELIIASLGLIITALVYTAGGVYTSTLAKTTKFATALSSMFIVFYIYLLPLGIGIVVSIFGALFALQAAQIEAFPIIGILLLYGGGFLASLNPIGAAIMTTSLNQEGYGYFFFSITSPELNATLWFVSPWVVYVLFNLLITLLLVRLAAGRLNRLSKV